MSACEIARTMSLFEIDEALDLLIESATEQAAEREISDELRTALSEHVDAFGDKVDRTANYIRAQEAFAEAAKKEASRLDARCKSAESRVQTCKGFLIWFMTCCSLKHLRGRVNTFTMANNSVDSLVLDEAITICAGFQSITLVLPWSDWQQLLSGVPVGPLHSKLLESENDGKSIDRARIVEALRSGQTVPGAFEFHMLPAISKPVAYTTDSSRAIRGAESTSDSTSVLVTVASEPMGLITSKRLCATPLPWCPIAWSEHQWL